MSCTNATGGKGWAEKIGNDILGSQGEELGGLVKLSKDGTKLVVSVSGYDGGKGSVRVYENKNNEWKKVGEDIIGDGSNQSRLGYSMALSSDGKIIVVSAPYDNNTKGYLKVYKLNDNNWVQIGSTFTGNNSGDYLGAYVSISSNGNVLTYNSSLKP